MALTRWLHRDIDEHSSPGPRSVAGYPRVNFLSFPATQVSIFSQPHDLSQFLTLWSSTVLLIMLKVIVFTLLPHGVLIVS